MQECESMNLLRRRDLGGACKKKTTGIFLNEFIRRLVRNTSELCTKVSGFPHRFATYRTPFTYETCASVGGIHGSLLSGRDIATLIVVLATLLSVT